MIEFVVYGMPAPQGSKRHVGGGRMIESSAKVKPWRQDVKAAAEAWIAQQCAWSPLDDALAVTMVFTLPKPGSAPKRKRTFPSRKPDLSKLVRSTEDALTDAGLIRDDARIVSCAAVKCYPGEFADALDRPGVRIRVEIVG